MTLNHDLLKTNYLVEEHAYAVLLLVIVIAVIVYVGKRIQEGRKMKSTRGLVMVDKYIHVQSLKTFSSCLHTQVFTSTAILTPHRSSYRL